MTGTGDKEVARVAAAQRGLITRDQLLAAGLGRGAVAHRLTNGRLQRVHPSVYAVGAHVQGRLVNEMAAVLHFRGFAALSERSAGACWGLMERPSVVTVTIAGRESHARPGICVHRVATLDRREFRIRNGLPVTAPARTLIDLAAVLDDGELERAVSEAIFKELTSVRELEQAIKRQPQRKGVGKLRRLLEDESGFSESEAERLMSKLLRAAGLPLPIRQVLLCGVRVDFYWPALRLVVEVDGYRFHGDRTAFESDRERDQVLAAAGFHVIRITYRQLRDQPLAVLARLAQVLARAA